MSETAVISARKIRLHRRAEQGDLGAKKALELARSPNRFLSTVQIGITLIGIFAGAYGGATIAEEIEEAVSGYPLLAPYGEAIGVVVVVLATTYLSLVIGELVPKRLALNNPERVAALVSRPMHLLSVIAAPVVQVLVVSTDSLLKLFRVKPSTEPAITQEELTGLVEQGILSGTFKQAEHDMIERVLKLDERRVSALMTPRHEIDWVDVNAPLDESFQKIAQSGHAYLPLCDGSLDNTLGVISVKNLWVRLIQRGAIDLRAEMLPCLVIPESARILTLVNLLQENRQHMALVIDEFAGIEGLITLTDILESIVGQMPSADDGPDESDIVEREDGSWLIDGSFPADELNKRFGLTGPPDGEKVPYHTLAGFIMSQLGHIPKPGDHFEWGGYRFEVVDMDGHRIDKVLLRENSQN